MEIIADNLHPKVLKNRLFINAVDYLIEKKFVDDQKGVSERTGITAAALSNIRNDKKIVSDKTIRKFLEGFPGIFNPAYFKGENIYMTLTEAMEAKMYAEEQKCEEEKLPHQSIDQSSLVNAALAAKDETIAALREQIQAKDDLIAALRQQIDFLQRQVHAAKDEELFKDFPFPKGIADKKDKPSAHV